ncbi:MAG: TonB family protein [Saprospiraceae bacterium]|nr:TonB family protein [Saprospiraceae bacterium]
MKKERKDNSFLKQPYYEGGDQALKTFITQNLLYPEQALLHQVEGSIPITYDINFKGEVTDVTLLHHLGHGCDDEAIRLVRLLKFKVPKLPRGMRVIFHKKITIHFRLPKHQEPKASEAPLFSYQIMYTPSVEVKEKEQKKQESSYTYTVNFGQ